MSIRAIKWAHGVLPDVTLPSVEVAVLLILAYHHDDKSGKCFPGIEFISERCGSAERRTRQAIKTLADIGLVKVRRGRGIAGNASNQYTLFGAPKSPKQTGRRVPVQEVVKPAQKSRFESGNRMPVSKRHTSADERGITFDGRNTAKFSVVSGGRA